MVYATNHKEVKSMPRRNGTGPMGAGSMTGRGLGLCTGASVVKYGAVFGKYNSERCGT